MPMPKKISIQLGEVQKTLLLPLSKTTLKTTGVSPWMKAFRIFNAWRHDIAPMVVTDMKITLFGFRNIVNQF